MAVPNKSCREDSSRAIYLSGEINQDLLTRLIPEIKQLQSASNDPITLYIDSPGGSTEHAKAILDLLKTPSQDSEPRWVITVAVTQAASAAADLLAAGDYSIAYPNARILYHGTRQLVGSGLTKEMAAGLSDYLGMMNQTYALQLASRAIDRLLFRYTQLKDGFDDARKEQAKPDFADIDCLMTILASKAPRQRDLLEGALDRYNRSTKLTEYIDERFKIVDTDKMSAAAVQANVFKHIFDYELLLHEKEDDFQFNDAEVKRVMEYAQLLGDYHSPFHSGILRELAIRWGMFFLNTEEQNQYQEVTAKSESDAEQFLVDTSPPYIRPFWHFCVYLCVLLQRGENQLTAKDAYWLGLVDEVPGSGNPCWRELVENRQEIEAAAKEAGTSDAKA